LTDFLDARNDPRLVIVDARAPTQRAEYDLFNPFFPVVYVPHDTTERQLDHMASVLGERHVVVVDVAESDAADIARVLRRLDLWAAPLERGLAGWKAAVVEESAEPHNTVNVIRLARIGYGLHSYILIEGGEAIVLNPSGDVECFVAELGRHACRPIAVVDSAIPHSHLSCGPDLSERIATEYFASTAAGASEDSSHLLLWRFVTQLDAVE
jgi:hypothetical protein